MCVVPTEWGPSGRRARPVDAGDPPAPRSGAGPGGSGEQVVEGVTPVSGTPSPHGPATKERLCQLSGSENTVDAAVWAAAIAAVVSIVGFLLNQWWARRERRARAFADAMAALTRWEQIPFTVWRRPNSSADTRSSIGREITDCYTAITYHVALLRIESPLVGEAYRLLVNKLQKQKNDNQDLAWRSPLLTTDEDMVRKPPFAFVNAVTERQLCRLAMRRELSMWSRPTRRDTLGRLKALEPKEDSSGQEKAENAAGD